MPKIARKTQKILGGSSSDNGQFGSAQAGTKILSNDPAIIQALSAWDNGWNSATVSGLQLPTLEEMQGVQYVQTYQLAYLFQEGIPEWDAGTTYYQKSIVKKTGTYELYGSLVNDNLNNALTDGTKWVLLVDLSSVLPDGDKGDIVVSAGGTTWTIDAGVVTLAKMANLANQRLIGRNTAGTGVPESVSLTQVLDWIGSAAQGDILYRGASAWARLPAGTNGYFLKTQGAGANPVWAAIAPAEVPLQSQVPSNAANVVFALDSNYDAFTFYWENLRAATDDQRLEMYASIDGGATYLSSGYDYLIASAGTSNQVFNTSKIQLMQATLDNTAATANACGFVTIENPFNTSVWKLGLQHGNLNQDGTGNAIADDGGIGIRTTSAITHVKFQMTTGNITSGNFRMNGRKFA